MKARTALGPIPALLLVAPFLFGNDNSPVTLDKSETLFAVLAAMNTCGYDAELASSDPVRMAIRGEIARNLESTESGKGVSESLCAFYRDHQQADAVRTFSQYVSLALYLSDPPGFSPKVKDADLPPDAGGVLGLVPLVGKFYVAAGLHDIWERHAAAYAELENRYRDPFGKMAQGTELYLRLPSGSYQGRTYTIYVEPMGPPSEINARNYGAAYYVVVAPGTGSGLKIEQIRHAYLHYLLDPMVGKYAANLNRLEPVLEAVKLAPMDESFKADPSLLVTECIIRSIEARIVAGGRAPLPEQQQAVDQSVAQGFVLTRYFYERLLDFEKDNVGFKNAIPVMLAQLDVRKEQRRASQVQFSSVADTELLHLSRPKEGKLLTTAEERLSAGDTATAEKLAQEALTENTEDPGRAFFILAQISLNRNINGARDYFERALKATSEPKVVAWSHIYLARILDLEDEQENGPLRSQAVAHYKAAVGVSDSLPQAKAAAEQGLQKPYEPPPQSGGGDSQPDAQKQ